MTQKPFFSIVIPTFNRADKLRFALYCLLRQSFRNFEIIVSDNLSTDHTKEVVLGFRDTRIRYVRNTASSIYSYNLKNAMNHANGEYVFFHSDDDLLPDKESLKTIAQKIRASKVGYARVNYLCVSPDRKKLFYFNLSQDKVYERDHVLPARSDGREMMSFLVHSDHYFITGLILKNSLPPTVRMIPSEHAPWIAMICHVVREYGGLFISKPHVVASWSTWRNKSDGRHPVYSLTDGRLECEYYFAVVRKYLSGQEYETYVHNQFMQNYVRIFPLIKTLIGNAQVLELSRRLRFLDPHMHGSAPHWLYLGISLITPVFMLRIMRSIFRSFSMSRSALRSSTRMLRGLRALEDTYLASQHTRPADQFRFF